MAENHVTSSDNILSEKVTRALQVRTDSTAMRASLQALSSSLENTSSSASSRNSTTIIDARSVRTAMEQDALHQAKLLQTALGDILGRVQTLQEGCSEVAQTAASLRAAASQPVVTTATVSSTLKAVVATTAADGVGTSDKTATEETLATRLSEAFAARDTAKQRVDCVQRFLEKFDLSDEDSELLEKYNFEDLNDLESMDGEVHNGWAFLSALERVRQIRQSLQSTFGSTTEDEGSAGLGANSALRIMESVSEKQERAYERLYQFLQQHADSSSPFVQQAITALRYVPAFYSHTMELVASARRAVVTRHFLLALTQGVDGGTPLELKAHDAVAYAGDMLAHIFKSFSVEADLAQSLLDPGEGENSIDDNQELSQGTDDPLFLSHSTVTASSILGIAVSGLCRPLKSRLLQVISGLSSHEADDDEEDDDDFVEDEGTLSRTKLAQLYEVCGLMLFYVSTLEKGLQKLGDKDETPNPLIECLHDCVKEGAAAYEASIRVYAAMLEHTASASGESQASIVHQLIELLSKIQSPATVDRILSIEWATETLVQAAQCTNLDDTAVLMQAVTAAQVIGMSSDKLTHDIQSKEQSLVDQMVADETTQVLELCGISNLNSSFQKWKTNSTDSPMANYPGLSQGEAESAVKEFYESLYSPPIPSLEGVVKDPIVRKRVRVAICDRVCGLYAELYDSMMEQGKYADLRFLRHTPKQVATLFTV